MSRIADALLGQRGPGIGSTAVMLDPRAGGMFGLFPNLKEWVSNQPYVPKNLICVLLEAPKGFQYLPNPEIRVEILKSLVEVHRIRITGLQSGLTVEVTETPVGGAGQMHEEPTNVTEERSQVTFTWNEKYGMPVFHFHADWIRNLIMDPNSKVASISTIAGVRVPDMLADMRGATMAFFEPDPSHTQVIKGWIGTNMYPKGTGENTGQFDLQSPGDKKDLDIAYTGIYQTGFGVNQLCQRLLDAINLTGANPYAAPAFIDGVSPEVSSSSMMPDSSSYAGQINHLGATSVQV